MSSLPDLAAQLADALGDGYAVERPLGEGGFAVVFLVRDLALKRDLAVKVLSPDMITSRTVLQRFRREAEMVAGLSHPNIVPLHFIGQRDDLLYLAMQCVDGGSIADRIESAGQLSVEETIRTVREVAAALSHAHRRGIVHRDIKPANVLIDRETGRCLVTDFGIARSAEASQLTATGMTLGTPAYLSPEQVTGEPSDHRVDIYALGVMAYEMLAGRVPFDAPTPTAAMMKRLAGPPQPIRELRPDVPATLAAAIERCLAADVAERFAQAADVIAALGDTAADVTPVGDRSRRPPARPRPSARSIVFGAGAVLATLGVVLAVRAGLARRTATGVELAGEPASAAADSSLVAIPAGDYVIGSDAGPPSARPRHIVHVAAFRIGRTEVTVGDYDRFVRSTRRVPPWTGTTPAGDLPVSGVSLGDADSYCAWRYPRGGRLPTEIEWEAAARGASGRAFPYGNTAEAAANTASARRRGPAPVGSFPRGATPEGVQDMSGNVWEWTQSPMRSYPGGAALPDSLAAAYRVIRGGAFDTADTLATAYLRGYQRRDAAPASLPNTGFRCAL